MKKNNKIVLISGSTGFIGQYISLEFAKSGCDICLHYYKNKKKAKQLRKQIKNFGVNVFCFKANLTRESEVTNLFKFVYKKFKKLDVLVNNAGIKDINYPLEKVNKTKLNLFFTTNVFSVFFTIKEAVKLMKKNGGSIINISSLVAIKGSYKNSIYSATKSAMDNLTISSYKEFKNYGIKINSVAPGNISKKSKLTKNNISPDEVANFISKLALDNKKKLNGQIIKITK